MVNNLKENFIKDGYVIIKNFINENEINKIYKELDIILNYIEKKMFFLQTQAIFLQKQAVLPTETS